MKNCGHENVTCLNQYDLIRKYHCKDCNEVVMCSCDKKHGERFLPHQLKMGSWEGSKEQVPVTLGFQENICPVCRGLKAVAAPTAPMHGATTKIVRYYWREIFFETTRRFYDANPNLDPLDYNSSEFNFPEKRREVEKQVISEIKKQHETNPKYEYSEKSQQEVIETTNTEVILVNAEHVNTGEKKVGIRNGDGIVTVEEYAADYFNKQGFKVLEVESVPFHVLFGIFMFLVIEDADDSKGRIVQFGSRNDFDTNTCQEGMITTILPDDFGSNLYFERQKELIDWHLSELDDLDWLFDYWLECSSNFRQYLWAHREKDISKAKEVMNVLGLENIKKVLNYMVMNYWKNFCGWPDLLVYDDNDDFFFVEVKSRNDKLSEDQKNWLMGNMQHMGFKAKIFKVGKL
ncbi:VRR-NUC domain-containing protein [Shewanella gelidimarina]|uniref:VRR-NUC domain-containing protein n=1 Tax=Shewanella gelidimarina TaxID=56813 RepID=UPI00200D8E36|nr:VRR-NUC domain-containing protein [Shewanella gelidimarina]MCL1059850.1 VRR-NUC domain-containing protein [Shewanella gelidimarina]